MACVVSSPTHRGTVVGALQPPAPGSVTERLLFEALQQALSQGQDAVVPLLLEGLGVPCEPVAGGATVAATGITARKARSAAGFSIYTHSSASCLKAPNSQLCTEEREQQQQQATPHVQHTQHLQQPRLAVQAELLLASAVRGGSHAALALLLHAPPLGAGLDVHAGSNRALRSAAARGDVVTVRAQTEGRGNYRVDELIRWS